MNPISIFFALASRQADIRRALALWESVKKPNTELIDLVRSILGDVGLLGERPPSPSAVPALLQQYDTAWTQRGLNKLENANLQIDGDLGGEDSKTRVAVRAFQMKHGIKVDGWPGVQTVAILAQELDKLA